MAREVRITVDDDEVFERMKARKRELDLSWEEVLHRGLERPEERSGDPGHPGASPPPGEGPPPGPSGPAAGRRSGAEESSRRRREAGVEFDVDWEHSGDSIGDVVEEIKDHALGEVRESLRASMGGPAGSLEREVSELEAAEDAVLRFDGVADGRRYEVPLRVRMETSRGGMAVDVVAVREGKSVGDANRFDSEHRRAVNEHLARGNTATLSLGEAETYAVAPVLTWGHGDDGNPTVTDVDVEAVVFDDE